MWSALSVPSLCQALWQHLIEQMLFNSESHKTHCKTFFAKCNTHCFILELAKYITEFSFLFKKAVLYSAWGRTIKHQTKFRLPCAWKLQQVTDVSLLWMSQATSRRSQKQVEPENQLRRGMQAIFLNNQIWQKPNVLRWPKGFSRVYVEIRKP